MSAPVPVPPFTPDGVIGAPLAPGRDPSRVVVIRLHAFGDTAITFPAIAALRRRLPEATIDVVTDIRSAELFAAHRDVDGVFSYDTRRWKYRKGLSLLRVALALRRRPVPAVVDLQRNRWSHFLTRLLSPDAWVGFDRHAPRTALTRYLDAVEEIGLGRLAPVLVPHVKDEFLNRARKRLEDVGWKAGSPLVCLNPAGGWETKQWPIERYVELGRRLVRETGCRLMALAAVPVPPRFAALSETLGRDLIDLSGTTTSGEALALVSLASLVVSEDSGLMHLAWVQGVPTLALFGSSRSAWSRPEGPRTAGFYSEDLACGACMQPVCGRGDLLCLMRVTVDEVFRKSLELLRGS